MEAEDVDAKFAAWQQMLAEYHATWVQLLHSSWQTVAAVGRLLRSSWQTASQQLADCFAAVGKLLCSSWLAALQQWFAKCNSIIYNIVCNYIILKYMYLYYVCIIILILLY